MEKSRKSIGDAVSYLQEKSNQEMALRREEIDLKKQEGRISLITTTALNATRNASDDSAATPRSTGEVSAATTSNHAVPSYTAATTI